MVEQEMVIAFLNTLKEPYYSHLLGYTGSGFADLVIVGERVEDGVKSGRLMDTQALQTLIDQGNASVSGRRVQTRCTEPGPRHEVQMIAITPANALQGHPSYPQAAS